MFRNQFAGVFNEVALDEFLVNRQPPQKSPARRSVPPVGVEWGPDFDIGTAECFMSPLSAAITRPRPASAVPLSLSRPPLSPCLHLISSFVASIF